MVFAAILAFLLTSLFIETAHSKTLGEGSRLKLRTDIRPINNVIIYTAEYFPDYYVYVKRVPLGDFRDDGRSENWEGSLHERVNSRRTAEFSIRGTCIPITGITPKRHVYVAILAQEDPGNSFSICDYPHSEDFSLDYSAQDCDDVGNTEVSYPQINSMTIRQKPYWVWPCYDSTLGEPSSPNITIYTETLEKGVPVASPNEKIYIYHHVGPNNYLRINSESMLTYYNYELTDEKGYARLLIGKEPPWPAQSHVAIAWPRESETRRELYGHLTSDEIEGLVHQYFDVDDPSCGFPERTITLTIPPWFHRREATPPMIYRS